MMHNIQSSSKRSCCGRTDPSATEATYLLQQQSFGLGETEWHYEEFFPLAARIGTRLRLSAASLATVAYVDGKAGGQPQPASQPYLSIKMWKKHGLQPSSFVEQKLGRQADRPLAQAKTGSPSSEWHEGSCLFAWHLSLEPLHRKWGGREGGPF